MRQNPHREEDGKPDFLVTLEDGKTMLVECKTASKDRYADGSFKVEVQKTRDSGAGRTYSFDQFGRTDGVRPIPPEKLSYLKAFLMQVAGWSDLEITKRLPGTGLVDVRKPIHTRTTLASSRCSTLAKTSKAGA